MLTQVKDTKNWIVAKKVSEDLLDQVLINRGIDLTQKDDFLNPDYESGLHDPWLLDGMNEAVERILKAISDKETIGVFGDYDADGIPATALMSDVLKKHGLDVRTYIPKRDAGYGLSREGIDHLKKEKVSLIVTVDLGITCRDEVGYAKELGIDVIVTDHHEVIKELLPNKAVALIDPKQEKSKYPFRELCGSGVAFKLACALCEKTGKLNSDQLKWYLDLVGISTFCDIVPLVDENRVLAKYGLVVLSKTKRIGLRKMYELANIDLKKINPYVVGFMIGPRLNAPGRMGDCSDSLRLLTTEDEEEAEEIANKLEKANSQRQDILKKTLKEADQKVLNEKLFDKKLILVTGKGWPDGIVGLVAGRLLEKYSRPTVVIGLQEDIGRGSARSIDGFSMVRALDHSKEYLVKHGGHDKAAGLTVSVDQVEPLYEKLLELANEEIKDEDLVSKIKIDAELKAGDLSWSLYKRLEKLEPFGLGNPRPVLVSYGVKCKKVTKMGKNAEHLRLTFMDDLGRGVGAVAFNFDLGNLEIKNGENVDIAYTLDKDEWRGADNIQLKILDLKKSVI